MNRRRNEPHHSSAISLIASKRRIVAGLVFLLSFGLIAQGCHSYQNVTKEELAKIKHDSGEDISVELTDGSSVDLAAYHYVWVDSPDTFMFGKGVIVDPSAPEARAYVGRMPEVEPIPVGLSVPKGWSGSERAKGYEFHAPDSSIVRVAKRDLVAVRAVDVPAIWYNNPDDGLSYARLAEEVEWIGAKRESGWKTALLIAGVVLGIASIVVGSSIAGMNIRYGSSMR